MDKNAWKDVLNNITNDDEFYTTSQLFTNNDLEQLIMGNFTTPVERKGGEGGQAYGQGCKDRQSCAEVLTKHSKFIYKALYSSTLDCVRVSADGCVDALEAVSR